MVILDVLKHYVGKTAKSIIQGNLFKLFDTSDIALIISEKFMYVAKHLEVNDAYIGVQIRTPSTFINKLAIDGCASDSLVSRTGGVHINELVIGDKVPYTYTRINHKDLVQVYNYDSVRNMLINRPVVGFRVDSFKAVMSGNDKFIFHFTEICGYSKVRLFSRGCRVIQEGVTNNDYLISSTNADDWIIGSPDFPLDPERISNKIIRINGKKAGSKPSRSLVIHSYEGLRLELDESAQKALQHIIYTR